MKFKVFKDIGKYYSLVYSYLIENEAKNILLFSILNSLKENAHQYGTEDPFLAIVQKNNDISLVILRTPPFNLVLGHTKNLESIKILVKELNKKNIELPGVLGFEEGADYFAKLWKEEKHVQAKLVMNERIYQLSSINEITLGDKEFGFATEEYKDLIIKWAKNFIEEALKDEENPEIINNYIDHIRNDISNRKIYLLFHNDEPVCMARKAGKTPNGNLVNFVYTPPDLRRRGFATECVAKLSEKLLEQKDNKFCFLFTDLSNPTSNSIYKKIGYRPIIDFHQYKFYKD